MTDSPRHVSRPVAPPDPLTASAREWHKLQVGALAFVGLCGVFTGDDGTRLPLWLQVLAGILGLAALATAALGLLLVALVAWPQGAPADPLAAARQLRAGVVLTCIAVGLVALSAASNWWPSFGDA